jgi:hypothetical protein
MIITRPILQRLSPSIREAAPQATDGSLQIPSLFSFVGLPPEPLFRAVTGVGATSSSVAVQVNAQVANAAQSILNPLSLLPGWWRLQIQGSYRSNYVLAGNTAGDFRIILADTVSNWQMVTKFAQLSGSQPIDFQMEFLISTQSFITSILDTNGVGQEHIYSLSIVAQRLL